MQTCRRLVPCLICLALPTVAVSLGAYAQVSDQGHRADLAHVLSDLDWLAGEWSGAMWGGEFIAYYSTPEGGKILSYSKLIKDGKVTFHEFEVFETHEHTLHLQPYPGGKPATGLTFKSHDPKSRKLVFENPKKDYPTRIVYQRVSEDNLVITLSDPFGKSEKTERFDLRRSAGDQ